LTAVAPLMALIALCILVESHGPVFYRATRVGYRGEVLHALKFRKMWKDAAGAPLTLDGDERFTRIGHWLAVTKLDELPQLFNVVRGQMSLIGPRPEDPAFVHRHAGDFERILQIRPGITGLSQLAFASESRILDRDHPVEHYERRILPQKLQLDKLYVSRWSLRLDAQILCWTVATVIFGIPVAVSRSNGRLAVRRRQTAMTRAPVHPPGDEQLAPTPEAERLVA
jgi:lipopolysaccharide/colanic/teichoic acid biosynthesis glycosyltransferase